MIIGPPVGCAWRGRAGRSSDDPRRRAARCTRSHGHISRSGGERVVAGVVAVAPGRGDRVLADELEVDEPRLLGGQLRRGVEPARQTRLAAAERARAQPAEGHRVVARPMAVPPLEVERAGGAIGVDRRRRDRTGCRGRSGLRGRAGREVRVHRPIVGPVRRRRSPAGSGRPALPSQRATAATIGPDDRSPSLSARRARPDGRRGRSRARRRPEPRARSGRGSPARARPTARTCSRPSGPHRSGGWSCEPPASRS